MLNETSYETARCKLLQFFDITIPLSMGHFQKSYAFDGERGLTQTSDPFVRRLIGRVFFHSVIFEGSMIIFVYGSPIAQCQLHFERFAI